MNIISILITILITICNADIYMHNMRGSNNRCDERTNERVNANRLFDSQNNAAGGYAVPCQDTDLSCFNMKYYTESILDIRFTTQHACGVQNQCEIIIQYACNMRNGNPSNSNGNTCTARMPDDINSINNSNYGYHESWYSYMLCKNRPRNLNLYNGDQILQGLSSIYTRQNPNGQRYGFECPEERDYYPYWNYSMWTDIAVMTSNISMCDYYKNTTNNMNLICININNTMVNRLGATYEGKSESSFKWVIPNIPDNNCVLRIRYNISLPTELVWFANKSMNNNIKTDPLIFIDGRYVRLALDTSQLPRTFQDRSYTFDIINRDIINSDINSTIYNINVMGKRGNIAQVRNCIEYDFVPYNITVTEDDYIHFQWVGSDFNPLGNDGEGRQGTDRSNLVDISDYFGYNRTQNNTFIPFDLIDSFIYLYQLDENCYNFTELILQKKILNTQDIKNCALLNNASVYFNSRLFKIKLNETKSNKTFQYMSTRNNNFSNRNQKGTLHVLRGKITTITTTTTTTTTTTISLQQLSNNSTSTSNKLEVGYIMLIIITILVLLGTIIYYVRNRNIIKKGAHNITNNIKRSFADKV